MNKVGIFLQDVASGLHFVKRYQPCAVLLMDASPLQIKYVRDNAPQTEIVWWKHEGDRHWGTTSPEWWADTIWAQIAACPPDYTYFWNEPLWHGAISQFADFDDRQSRFIKRMRQLSGGKVKVGAFCFAEGNFTKDGPDIPTSFPKSMDEAEMVFIHEYWKPRLNSPGMVDYHCLRWPHWLEQFEKAGRPDLPIAITECGLTMAVGGGPDVGYLSAEAMAAGVTWQLYRDDLAEYHIRCCQEPRVKFMIPFLCSPWAGQWQTFRLDIHTELLDHIMTMGAPGPPTPPSGGSMKIYDFDKTEKDAAWLKTTWGVEVKPGAAQVGEKCFAVQAVRIDEGPCAILNNVKDSNGNPLEKILVAFHWPGAPDPPESGEPPYTTPVYNHDWELNFVFGLTNIEGDWGGAMGRGAMINEGSPGPHSCWIHHPQYDSDCVTGLGWRTGTNHRAPRLEWKLMTKSGGEEPVTYRLEIKSRIVVTPWPSAEMVLKYPKKKPDGANFATDTRGQARIFNVPPETYDPDLELPFEMDGYAAVKNCCDYDGSGSRTYQLMVTQYGSSEIITPIVEETFVPKPDFRRVIFTVDWVEEEPEPPTPPPSDDIAAILRDDANTLRAVVTDIADVADDLDAIADIIGESGEVVSIIVIYQDGRQVTFESKSLTSRIVAAVKSVFGR